jgi:acylphosphatase
MRSAMISCANTEVYTIDTHRTSSEKHAEVSNMEKVRARVIVEGRVQGVFFRHHTEEMAFRLGVKGWVKNRRDGRVEALFEGDRERVDQIIQWCHQGPSEARVTKVYVTWENYAGEFDDFSVTY